MGLAATLAPAVAPTIRRGLEGAYAYMTSPAPSRGSVQRIIRASHEPKNYDVYVNGPALSSSTAPFTFLVNDVDQGTGGTNRTGRQYVVEKIDLRILFRTDGTGLVGDSVRIIVFVDKECRGAAAGSADLLVLNGSNLVQTISNFNFDNVPTRFKILHDETYALNVGASPTTTTTVPVNRPVHIVLKPKQRVHCYNTTGGGIADIDSGSIIVFAYSATATVSHATDIDLHSRIVFRDL